MLFRSYSAVGVLDLKFTIFLARNVEKTHELALDEAESVEEVVEIPLAEAIRRVRSGEINDGESALAILLAAKIL